jgi:hypothetical protein
MKRIFPQGVVIGTTFIWIGLIIAISFLEAWIKFRAPGVTLSLGLGIGRLVFSALNRVEWGCLLVIAASSLLLKRTFPTLARTSLTVVVLLLLLQTFWLLPQLDARAQLYIDGQSVPASNLHFYYPAIEVVKVCFLFMLGIAAFKQLFAHSSS